jgi:hypothetical protein
MEVVHRDDVGPETFRRWTELSHDTALEMQAQGAKFRTLGLGTRYWILAAWRHCEDVVGGLHYPSSPSQLQQAFPDCSDTA